MNFLEKDIELINTKKRNQPNHSYTNATSGIYTNVSDN